MNSKVFYCFIHILGVPIMLEHKTKTKTFFYNEQIMFTSFRYIFNRLEFKGVLKIANVPLKRDPVLLKRDPIKT